MTNFFLRPGRTIAAAAVAGVLALTAAGCSSETLLEVTDPDLINPADVASPEGAAALRTGALSRFRGITAGGESTWLFGGLLADEWSTSSTFVQNDETDERRIQTNNSSITGMFRDLARVRTATNQAIAGLREFLPDRTTDIAEMYFARGFAEMQLAQDYCNGIPLSDAAGATLILGEPLTVAEVLERAVASYDSALALTSFLSDDTPPDVDEDALFINRAARIGKARALVGLGRYQDAANALVVDGDVIPTAYSYDHTFAVTTGSNILWSQGVSQRRYTVGDSLEGNSRNFLVANAIPFFSAADPRLPVTYTVSDEGDTTKSQDGFTFSRTTPLYGRTTSVPVVNGIDTRLIEAEVALQADDAVTMLAILNTLRAAPPTLGEVDPDPLPALSDPGTEPGRVDLLFREKAFWTFSRGQRLGDLRRLIRQYGRTEATTFPSGLHYRGGSYGADVNLPVPQQEENNENFTGCLNRDA